MEELIVKSLQQKLSAAEQQQLDAWLQQSSDNQKLYEQIKAAWDASENYFQQSVDVEAAWKKVKAKTIGEAKVVRMQPQRWIWAAAASVTLLLGFGIYQYFLSQPTMKTIATLNEQKQIKLEDGSMVWLNANSSITFPEKFTANRKVALSGEAFFDVMHNEKSEFVITANGTLVKDIGTSFNIRAYEKEAVVQVSVASGIVAFSTKKTEPVTLKQGEAAEYNISLSAFNKTKTSSNYLAWKTGELIFENTPLPDVVEDLQHFYNLQLLIKDSTLTKVSFTATLKRQPQSDALKILESSLGLRVVRDSAQHYSLFRN